MSSIPNDTKLGLNVVIEDGVKIGHNVVIGHNTVIYSGTIIGDHVTIGSNCVMGIRPAKNKRMRDHTQSFQPLYIGNYTQIGHGVSLYEGVTLSTHCFVGDHASIRENVTIGIQTIIGRASIIELNTTIGDHCTIQTLAYVTGDSIIENHVFIGPCVSMSNDKYMGKNEYKLKGPHLEEGVKIGNNATLLPSIIIKKNAIIGAGAVVTKNVEANHIVAGVPAKTIKTISSNP